MRLLVPALAVFFSVACSTQVSLSSDDRTDPFAEGDDRNADPDGTADDGDREFDASTEDGEDDGDRDFEGGEDDDDDRDFEDGGPPGSDEDLCRTRGFWSNHEDLWPTDAMELGDRSYSAVELLDLLDLPSNGDASLILAAQLVAAELNVAIGAPADASVVAAMDDAHAWLAAQGSDLPYGVPTSSPAGAEATALGATLDAFNNQHCD